jgi:hypothetical protein
MMAEMGWREAVIEVLNSSDKAMHYTTIADEVAKRKLKKQFGATPATAVNVVISNSFRDEGQNSPFVRVERGVYWLRIKSQTQNIPEVEKQSIASEETGLINAFGMYWSRELVHWKAKPQILGQQQQNSTPIDFSCQNGVYLLHDGRAVVYVGRTTDQPLGARLQQHTVDRLNSRWSRFSWFGIYGVLENGQLNQNPSQTFNVPMLIATMEALLIEGLEPPQNRKRGDDLGAFEYIQVRDPEIERIQKRIMLDEMKSKLL